MHDDTNCPHVSSRYCNINILYNYSGISNIVAPSFNFSAHEMHLVLVARMMPDILSHRLLIDLHFR